jgi:acetylornithine deacetylase/succinyl-diaminopimelate desuccinylase-like protein
VADALKAAGLENVEIIETEGHPLVYADWLHAEGKPTVLCYGHYDVQPPDPLELWKSPPFKPSIRDGNLYARGSADDKGQMYIHVKAMEALMRTQGSLPVNVKFLVEGEEEIGGKSVAKYVAANPEKLKADVALVSDTAMYAPGLPTLCVGLRGLVYTELAVKGPARDLHSGLYGGAAPNPIFALIELLSQAKDAAGRIQIPGFYDDVENAGPVELESWQSLPFNEAEFLSREVGATALTGESEYSVLDPPHARSAWHRRRLHRRGSQNRHPRRSHRQGQLPAGAQPESRKDRRSVSPVCRRARPGRRRHRSTSVERRARLHGEPGPSGNPCRGLGLRRDL